MVFNTATVGTAVTPAIVSTFFSHYLDRKTRHEKPTAHISYDQGLHLIRKFLLYASHHTVEELQRFTAQWVPHPTWVRVQPISIPSNALDMAAELLREQLGPDGLLKVGGKSWWTWRRDEDLRAEWIEMKSDWQERKDAGGGDGKRAMLYVHGGAYFFGSVDEHRYQMQRHARKLKAQVFAPNYRLAPQFPFPCGLHDCLAAYLFLLQTRKPETIVLAGDSAGGGMIVSMLVTMRDRGIPLPAGAILISPWVDLTHSFPSVAAQNPLDYIPPHGFHQQPSAAWPPPNADDLRAIYGDTLEEPVHQESKSSPQIEGDAVQGFHAVHNPTSGTVDETAAAGTATSNGAEPRAHTVPGSAPDLSIMINGKTVVLKDQIQMYTSNQLVAHPLVSPILQPSLGGLPPLLILTGGGEMLRDEQIFLAHKAAHPTQYPPGDAFLNDDPDHHDRKQIDRWKPTDVQLQVWDDLCHVAPTLSFTRPAKYMYRSVAQFGAWALARAQKTEIEILDDDDISVISSSDEDVASRSAEAAGIPATQVGKAGDALPDFKNHMIRQRVDRHGNIYPLEPASELPACNMSPADVGVIKEGPVRLWLEAKVKWDAKFAISKRQVQKQRAKEMAKGYVRFGDGEVPPPSALAGRRTQEKEEKLKKKRKSRGLALWASWGSKHDKMTMDREEAADRLETTLASPTQGGNARPLHDTKTDKGKELDSKDRPIWSRSSSRRRMVTDQHQTSVVDLNAFSGAEHLYPDDAALSSPTSPSHTADEVQRDLTIRKSMQSFSGQRHIKTSQSMQSFTGSIPSIRMVAPSISNLRAAAESEAEELHEENTLGNETNLDLKRPKAGGVAFPFTVKGHERNPSMMTLTSEHGIKGLGAGSPLERIDTETEWVSEAAAARNLNGAATGVETNGDSSDAHPPAHLDSPSHAAEQDNEVETTAHTAEPVSGPSLGEKFVDLVNGEEAEEEKKVGEGFGSQMLDGDKGLGEHFVEGVLGERELQIVG